VFGWKDDTLQRAIDSRCTGDKCTELKYQDTEEAMKCNVPTAVQEEVDGCKCSVVSSCYRADVFRDDIAAWKSQAVLDSAF
jgi:hypothetical protein